jgi:hypothetical protein
MIHWIDGLINIWNWLFSPGCKHRFKQSEVINQKNPKCVKCGIGLDEAIDGVEID